VLRWRSLAFERGRVSYFSCVSLHLYQGGKDKDCPIIVKQLIRSMCFHGRSIETD
jgi:hypothetical protein